MRKHPGLDSVRECISVQNTDVWVHRYSPRKEKRRKHPTVGELIDQIQHIEVKAFDAEEPFAQKDTFSVVDDLLRSTSIRKNGRRYAAKIKDRRKPGQKRFVRWLGHHVLQMSSDRPDSSDRLIWDGKHTITEDVLVQLLRFDRNPDHPDRFLDTRRHHVPPKKEHQLPLLLPLKKKTAA